MSATAKSRRWAGVGLFFLLCAGVGQCGAAEEKPGAAGDGQTALERLLPESTLGFVSAANVPQLIGRWKAAGFQPGVENPALSAVLVRIEEQLPQPWLDAKLDWAELLARPSYPLSASCTRMDG